MDARLRLMLCKYKTQMQLAGAVVLSLLDRGPEGGTRALQDQQSVFWRTCCDIDARRWHASAVAVRCQAWSDSITGHCETACR